MIDLRAKAISILSSLSDGERESIRDSLAEGFDCYRNAVPPIYYDDFLVEIKNILGVTA